MAAATAAMPKPHAKLLVLLSAFILRVEADTLADLEEDEEREVSADQDVELADCAAGVGSIVTHSPLGPSIVRVSVVVVTVSTRPVGAAPPCVIVQDPPRLPADAPEAFPDTVLVVLEVIPPDTPPMLPDLVVVVVLDAFPEMFLDLEDPGVTVIVAVRVDGCSIVRVSVVTVVTVRPVVPPPVVIVPEAEPSPQLL